MLAINDNWVTERSGGTRGCLSGALQQDFKVLLVGYCSKLDANRGLYNLTLNMNSQDPPETTEEISLC